MVRAAVSGAIDYSRSDPTDINWRLKQKLVLHEIQRREEVSFLAAVHQQWLAYVSHGGLTPESFKDVKKSATGALDDLQEAIFPWIEFNRTRPKSDSEDDTMVVNNEEPELDPETQKLVNQYKIWQKQREEEAAAKKAAEAQKGDNQ